jgi:hypothetical protein
MSLPAGVMDELELQFQLCWLMCSVVDSSWLEAVGNDPRHHCGVIIVTWFIPLFYICHDVVINHHRHNCLPYFSIDNAHP